MKKGFSCLCVILGISLVTSPVYASTAPYGLPDEADLEVSRGVFSSGSSEEESATIHMSIDEAVAYGLAHNLDLQSLANQLLLANVKMNNANVNGEDIEDAKDDLTAAGVLLNKQEDLLLTSKEALRDGKEDLEDGLAPDDIVLSEAITIEKGEDIREAVTELVSLEAEALISETVAEKHDQVVALINAEIDSWPETMSTEISAAKEALAMDVAPFDVPVSDEVVIAQGSSLTDALTELVMEEAYSEENMADMQATIDEKVALIIDGVEVEFSSAESDLDEAEIAISEATATLEAKWSTYDSTISDASREMEDMIGYNSTISFDASDAKQLMVTMARVNLSVTDYAQEIYENQIAMLIRKDYYDALYAEKLLEVKEKAEARGKVQFDMIQVSYDNGMKAKDDYLLAKMFYEGTQLEARLAQANYNNALYTLKNDMNFNLGDSLVLSDTLEVTVTEEDLDAALKNGLTNRIEIQQSLGQRMICRLNDEIIDDMAVTSKKSYQETEAQILIEEAEIGLLKNKFTVASQIHQSYELMTAAADMVETSAGLIEAAEEVVAIAQLKYEQGLGAESALLASLNLESSGGTILEVMAAQENLTEVEAQVAQINYSYIMAKCKFQNDAALLVD